MTISNILLNPGSIICSQICISGPMWMMHLLQQISNIYSQRKLHIITTRITTNVLDISWYTEWSFSHSPLDHEYLSTSSFPSLQTKYFHHCRCHPSTTTPASSEPITRILVISNTHLVIIPLFQQMECRHRPWCRGTGWGARRMIWTGWRSRSWCRIETRSYPREHQTQTWSRQCWHKGRWWWSWSQWWTWVWCGWTAWTGARWMPWQSGRRCTWCRWRGGRRRGTGTCGSARCWSGNCRWGLSLH